MAQSPAHANTDFYERETMAFVKPVSISHYSGNLLFKFNPEFSQNLSFERERVALINSKIKNIKNLSDNWDGQGAVSPKKRVIDNTFRFLNLLLKNYALGLEPENITPTPYGTVQLDWIKNDNLLSIEIGLNKIGFFTSFPNKPNLSSDGFVFNGTKLPLNLVNAFDQLFAD